VIPRRRSARTLPDTLRPLSALWLRLLALNVLLVFLPVAGLLYFNVFERELLDAQEKSMVQQGRLVVAFLESRGRIDAAEADSFFSRLALKTTARLRVLNTDGRVVADASRSLDRDVDQAALAPDAAGEPRDSLTYKIGNFLFRIYSRLMNALDSPDLTRPDVDPSGSPALNPEVRHALSGRYGAAWRVSPGQRSITLYSALPVRINGEVAGAVLVSQSTLGVLQALYQARVSVFQVFLISVVVAVFLSLIISTTIAQPLRDLSRQASALLDVRGRIGRGFRVLRRQDEIGELSRSLDELAGRLRERIHFADAFAADVAHEFRNPLASIRSAVEMMAEAEDPDARTHFHSVVMSEVARLEWLLTDLREIARLDSAPLEGAEPVELNELIRNIVQAFCIRGFDRLEFAAWSQPVFVSGSPDQLARCLENVIENATGFTGDNGPVEIFLTSDGRQATIGVRDHGPGIPEQHLQKVFDRFFTHRPGTGGEKSHSGLGLAIARAIVRNHAGEIRASNHPFGGALFEVVLPLAASHERTHRGLGPQPKGSGQTAGPR
jgi:two-component system, OmpR family, sensor histidine kinase ChvG